MYALRLTKDCFLRRHVIIAIGLAAPAKLRQHNSRCRCRP